jgi:peptidoglycan/LPS O-acetylase OafA/YrhL
MTTTSPAAARSAFKDTSASVLLDLIRGLAALAVLAEHWRNLFFLDYSLLPHHNLFLLVLYLLTGAGHQAVMIFFVLSGYLIGGSVFRSLGSGQWSWMDYLLHRFTRLWIVLIPGLLLGLLWDWIGVHHTAATLLYTGHAANHMIPDVAPRLTALNFFGNLAFLQTLYVPTFGSNGALWSLANEFWYYILFPLGVFALRKSTRLVPRLLCIALFLLLAWTPCRLLLPSFPIWLAGALLAKMPVLRLTNFTRIAVAVVYAVLYLGMTHQPFVAGIRSDFIFAIITFFFFWIMLSANDTAKRNAATAFSRSLSSFSYTLYVVHIPLLLLLVALFVGDDRWDPSPRHLALGIVILLLTVAYAWIIASCTEIHTHHVVAWLKKKIA